MLVVAFTIDCAESSNGYVLHPPVLTGSLWAVAAVWSVWPSLCVLVFLFLPSHGYSFGVSVLHFVFWYFCVFRHTVILSEWVSFTLCFIVSASSFTHHQINKRHLLPPWPFRRLRHPLHVHVVKPTFLHRGHQVSSNLPAHNSHTVSPIFLLIPLISKWLRPYVRPWHPLNPERIFFEWMVMRLSMLPRPVELFYQRSMWSPKVPW